MATESADEQLAKVATLRADPHTPGAREVLAAALGSKVNLIVAKAADVIAAGDGNGGTETEASLGILRVRCAGRREWTAAENGRSTGESIFTLRGARIRPVRNGGLR
jgi:hypothetical protein